MDKYIVLFFAVFSIGVKATELKICSLNKKNCEQLLNHAEFLPSKKISSVRFSYTVTDHTYRPSPDLMSNRRVEPAGCGSQYIVPRYRWLDDKNNEISQPHYFELNKSYSLDIYIDNYWLEDLKNCEKFIVDFPAIDYSSEDYTEPFFHFKEREPDYKYACYTDLSNGQIKVITELSMLSLDKISYKMKKENGEIITGIALVTYSSCDHFNTPGCIEGSIFATDYENKVDLNFNGRTGLLKDIFGGVNVNGRIDFQGNHQYFNCEWMKASL